MGPDDVLDAEDFKISTGGVLEFREKPDYENPADAGMNNEYNVVVQASDGATMASLSWFKVTVNVTDLEETGSVKLRPTEQTIATTLLQPQVKVGITAHSLTDPDGSGSNARSTSTIPAGNTTWQWYKTSSRTATGMEIEDEEAPTYTPTAATGSSDVGRYLRVIATYTDGRSGTKTATAVSDYPTIAEVADNTGPRVPCGNHCEGGARGNAQGHAPSAPQSRPQTRTAERC